MLVIRMARGGRTKYPVYRIVAAESARAATGKFIEVLGHYNPHTKDLVIKKDEVLARLSHGAQPSNSVVKLLQRENIELPDWVKLKTKASKAVVEDEVVVDEATSTPDDEAPSESETPAEETTQADDSQTVATAANDAAQANEDNAVDGNVTETAESDPSTEPAATS